MARPTKLNIIIHIIIYEGVPHREIYNGYLEGGYAFVQTNTHLWMEEALQRHDPINFPLTDPPPLVWYIMLTHVCCSVLSAVISSVYLYNGWEILRSLLILPVTTWGALFVFNHKWSCLLIEVIGIIKVGHSWISLHQAGLQCQGND